MRDYSAAFEDGPGSASSRGAAPGARVGAMPRPDAPSTTVGPLPQPGFGGAPFDLRALRAALRGQPGYPAADSPVEADSGGLDAPGPSADAPTNVYYLARYTYQISINAVTMADHELGLLLPRSGRVWFNAKLFTGDVPSGRELAQRDAWWRVVDTSPAVRFLLGWCLSLYKVARFRGAPREQLPGWSRMLHFSPVLAECSKSRVQLWSDVIQETTALFAPPERVWRQLQMFGPIRMGDPRWHTRLALANHRVDDVLQVLADRNTCPPTLIRRMLDGNPPIGSYDEYLRFAEALCDDLPVLKLQRSLTLTLKANALDAAGPAQRVLAHLPGALRPQWISQMEDPRHTHSFWHLHL